jgi:peptide/nickel transport system permease protein
MQLPIPGYTIVSLGKYKMLENIEIALNSRAKKRSLLNMVWYEFQKNRLAVIGLIFLLFIFLAALFAKYLMPYDPLKLDNAYALGQPKPPNGEHWFGTDEFGRDLFSRALSGAQVSLSVGFVAVGISTLIGVILGCLAGYYGRGIDNIIMRGADIFLSLPTFYLILSVNSFLKPSIYNIMVIIGLFNWMGVSRLVRGEFLRIKEMDFITAAYSVGIANRRIIARHMLPNSLAPIIVSATISIPGAILLESALSFLGLGVPPPLASWGNMLYDGKLWLHQAWWMWIPPGLLISITVIAFNFVGDGLRDAFDPQQRGR